MTDIFSLANIIAFGGYIIAGVLVVLGMFGMQTRQRRTDDDSVATNLINNLKLTVEQQNTTIIATNTKLDQTTKELHVMQGRNNVLEQLFNGSEGSILSFLKEAPELMRVAKENNQLSKSNADDIAKLTASINMLVTALTPKSA